jgi:hypothetical protein
MINAKEAAEKADKAHLDLNNSTLKSELAIFEKELAKAISQGNRGFSIDKLSQITKKHIIELGYSVKYYLCDMNDYAYSIKF